MTATLEAKRAVVLDILERAADLEETVMDRLYDDFGGGMTVPPPGHELREEFEQWAADAGCRVKGAIRAPMVTGRWTRDGTARPLFRLPKGKWVGDATGRRWVGEGVSWLDGGADPKFRQDAQDWNGWLERTARDCRLLKELRALGARPPGDDDLEGGWDPGVVPLEQHEAAILAGDDPETGLPLVVAEWLGRLVHAPKQEYARAYCSHRLYGDPEPADPGEQWAVKARKRADHVLRAVSS